MKFTIAVHKFIPHVMWLNRGHFVPIYLCNMSNNIASRIAFTHSSQMAQTKTSRLIVLLVFELPFVICSRIVKALQMSIGRWSIFVMKTICRFFPQNFKNNSCIHVNVMRSNMRIIQNRKIHWITIFLFVFDIALQRETGHAGHFCDESMAWSSSTCDWGLGWGRHTRSGFIALWRSSCRHYNFG